MADLMSKYQRFITKIIVTILVGSAVYGQNVETFKARLSTSPIPLQMKATGSGLVTAQLNGKTLTISGTFEGLRASASAARIHRGPKTGVRGPAIFDLTVTNSMSGTVSGSIELSAAQIDDLKNGRLYIQIEPEGNIWGWLLP